MPSGVYVRTQEHKTAMKRRIPWNKGIKSPYSKESLDKMSKSHKGKKQSKETIEKRIGGLRGKPRTLKVRNKISLAVSMERHGMWKGGRINDGRYIRIRQGKKYLREHRLTMEKQLMRVLRPGEVVHHLDGNRMNNSPSNLKLFASSREHMLFHKRNKKGQWMMEVTK